MTRGPSLHTEPLLNTSSLHPSPEPFHGESDMKPYRGDKPILERLLESPLPSLNRIGQDRADAAASEIEHLRLGHQWACQEIAVAIAERDEARSLLAAAWENAAKIAEDNETTAEIREADPNTNWHDGHDSACFAIAAALRAAGKEVSERNSTHKAVTPPSSSSTRTE